MLTTTFSALSSAAAVLLFLFAGYFLLQTNSLSLPNEANLQLQVSTQSQVAVVPTVGLRSANPTEGELAPTSAAAAQMMMPTATLLTTDRERTNIPATPSPLPTMPAPGASTDNEQANAAIAGTTTAMPSVMLEQGVGEASAPNPAQTEGFGGGVAGADEGLFAADSAVTEDDQTNSRDFSDTDSAVSPMLADETAEQGGAAADGVVTGSALAVTATALAPPPQTDTSAFRIQPTLQVPTSVESIGQSDAQEPSISLTDEASPADESHEEGRADIIEPTQQDDLLYSPSQSTTNAGTIGLVLLLAGGLLLGIAIGTTAIRRRRQS
jgi:hypothetical protein